MPRPNKEPVKTYNSGDAALALMAKMGAGLDNEKDDCVQVNIHMSSDMKNAVKKAAKDNGMTASGYVRWLLMAALKSGGYM